MTTSTLNAPATDTIVAAPSTLYAWIVVRSIHAKRGSSGWAGPGLEIRLVTARRVLTPDELTHSHEDSWLAKNGIKVVPCGTGYWNRRGPRSNYGQAIAYAKELAAEQGAILL